MPCYRFASSLLLPHLNAAERLASPLLAYGQPRLAAQLRLTDRRGGARCAALVARAKDGAGHDSLPRFGRHTLQRSGQTGALVNRAFCI